MYRLYSIFVFIFLLGVMRTVSAAEVRFLVVPSTMQGDTASVVEVRFNPEGEVVNAIEGAIAVSLPPGKEVASIVLETGDSFVTLWAVPPEYDTAEGVIRFTGGIPQGITEEGLLFRARLFSRADTDLTFSWLGGSAYRADGFGTPLGVSSRSLRMALGQNEPNLINPASADSHPPEFESVIVSRDPDIYEGQYFVSFHATDDVSGIVRYEIVENGIRTETTQGIYLLRDQERRSKVVLIAYDQAGNSTSVQVPHRYTTYVWYGCTIFGFIVLLWILRKGYYRVRSGSLG